MLFISREHPPASGAAESSCSAQAERGGAEPVFPVPEGSFREDRGVPETASANEKSHQVHEQQAFQRIQIHGEEGGFDSEIERPCCDRGVELLSAPAISSNLHAFAASLGLMLICLMMAGCEKLGDDTVEAALLAPWAGKVSQDSLEELVSSLVRAHQEDEPIDCSLFDGDVSFEPDCRLTRDQARELVKSRFEQYGYKVRTQTQSGPVLSTENVFVDLPGRSKPREVVLIGAHFDAFYAGADDNSSGMAVVLEAARVLAEEQFERTIRFIAFDLEEVGLVGSSRYVASLGSENVVAAIILDCVAYTSSEPGSQRSIPGLPAPTVGDFLAVFASSASADHARQMMRINEELELLKLAAVLAPDNGAFPLVGNLLRSDHAPFWLSGKPAVFLTDTANFRNPHYHTDTDTLDTLDFEFLTQVTRLSLTSLVHWAEVAE